MPIPKKDVRLSGNPAHQKLTLANLATQLTEHRALITAEARAEVLQPYLEKLVTRAKRDDLHIRRTVAKKVTSKEAMYMLFDETVPELDPERSGGYTRLIRVGNREGDNVPLVRIEIVLEKVEEKAVVKTAEAVVARVAEKAEGPTKDEAAKVESTEAEVPEAE